MNKIMMGIAFVVGLAVLTGAEIVSDKVGIAEFTAKAGLGAEVRTEALIQQAFASEASNAVACEGDGIYDGKNNPFSQGLYKMCKEIGAGDAYYNGFIEGCMSVEGNTQKVCEQATDAD